MNISIINDERITYNKGGSLSAVDDVVEFDNLQDLATVLTTYNIAPAIFHDVDWIDAGGTAHQGMHKVKSNLKSIQFLCFDFDEGKITAKEIHTRLKYKNKNHVIAASKNHLKDKCDGKGVIERFHLFMPLDQEVTDASFYKYMAKKQDKLMGWGVDSSCAEAARYFHKHPQVLYVCEEYENLKVDRFERLLQYDSAEQKQKENYFKSIKIKYSDSSKLEEFKKCKYYRQMAEEGALQGDGNRYSLSNSIIACMKKTYGLDLADALGLFDEYSNYGKSFTRNSVIRRLNDF